MAGGGASGGSRGESFPQAELAFAPHFGGVVITLNNRDELAERNITSITIKVRNATGALVDEQNVTLDRLGQGYDYAIADGEYSFELLVNSGEEAILVEIDYSQANLADIRDDGRISVGEDRNDNGRADADEAELAELAGLLIDRDGDGLVEISTAAEFNTLVPLGCAMKGCTGYELVNDISLAAYGDGEGWQPIGRGSFGGSDVGCEGKPFVGHFEGNGHRISDLTIRRPEEDCIGLFGYLAAGSEIRNLRLEASIIEGGEAVGALLGWGRGIGLSDLVVIVDLVNGSAGRVGGLAGDATHSNISEAEAEVGSVIGLDNTGGLIGFAREAIISHSFASSAYISGEDNVGGLIGDGERSDIMDSSALSNKILAVSDAGGLVGDIQDGSKVIRSEAVSDYIKGDYDIGGLVGDSIRSDIIDSSAFSTRILADTEVGGLVGDMVGGRIIRSDASSFNISTPVAEGFHFYYVGGLVGSADRIMIIDSSATTQLIRSSVSIGGLVGSARSLTVKSSTAFSDSLVGIYQIGGLVGYQNSGLIANSSAVSRRVLGRDEDIGGLVGDATSIRIRSSYAVANEVRAGVGSRDTDSVSTGGLVGFAKKSTILYSYAITGSVRGRWQVGGLVGTLTDRSALASSYSATGSIQSVSTGRYTGGLVGIAHDSVRALSSSYAVTGDIMSPPAEPRPGGLIGDIRNDRKLVKLSYWDSNTSGIETSSGLGDRAQTTDALRSPIGYTGIYADWARGADIDNADGDSNAMTGIDNITIWCDEDISGAIEEEEKRDDNRVWHFGSARQYPTIHCVADSPQDRWWFVNETSGRPQLNASLLTEVLRREGL